jgi:hypothetical protein
MPEQDAVQVADSDEIGISVADAKVLLAALEPALHQIWREKNDPPNSPPTG